MTWTTPADLRAQVRRWWDRGDLLRACVGEEFIFPRSLVLKKPNAADLRDRFPAVREWAQAIVDVPRVRIEAREWSHRVQGVQQLPDRAWVDSLDDALEIIEKRRASAAFFELWTRAVAVHPALAPWLRQRPLVALELPDVLDRLLAVVSWVKAHPRSGLYLRQIDVPLVDTKFVEAHRGVLIEWLDLVLAQEAVDAGAKGVANFARRYGFREKPVRIRFRLLDSAISGLAGCHGLADITLDADSFSVLSLPVDRVFIIENEINFLSFPAMPRAIAIFGAGYGFDALARAAWLECRELHYWGDIDTHGFAILDQLRSHFPRVSSLLMDRETLMAHRVHWGEESMPVQHDLTRLTGEELLLYDDLRFGRLACRLRLEQERVGYGWLLENPVVRQVLLAGD